MKPTKQTTTKDDNASKGEVLIQNYKEPLKPVAEVLGQGYGYMGTLITDKEKTKLQCHLCGKFFVMLNRHIRLHNLQAYEYKKIFHLSPTTALIGEAMRERMSEGYLKRQLNGDNARKGLEAYWQEVREGKRPPQKHNRSLEWKNKNGSCPEQLLKKIKVLAEELGRTPSSNEFSRLSGSNAHTVRTVYGSWGNALRLLGMTEGKPGFPPRHTEESVLQAIQDFYGIHGRIPRKSDFNRGYVCSTGTIRKLFGTTTKARELAGVGNE